MPIVVVCPACSTKLAAPDDAGGKHVRCPRAGCGTLVPVPAMIPAEVVEPPRPKPPRPRDEDDEDDRTRRRRDEDDEDEEERPRRKKRRRDDEDDDYEFDHPRRRRRKKGGGAGKTLAILGIVFGVLVVLGGIGYGIYALAGKGKAKPPAGWQQYTYPDDGFRAYFPQEPQVHKSSEGKVDLPVVAGRRPESFTLYVPQKRGPGTHAEVTVVRFPATFTIDRHDLIDQIRRQRGEVTDKPITWLGGNGYEVAAVDLPVVSRIVLIDKTRYMVTLASIGGPMSAAERDGYFDNFEVLR